MKKHLGDFRPRYRKAVFEKWLPSCSTFAIVEAIQLAAKILREEVLSTRVEIRQLIGAAKDVVKDLLVRYRARVGTTRRGRLLVLGKHKRSKAMTAPTLRIFLLDEVANAVVQRLTRGRSSDERLILNGEGKHNRSSAVGWEDRQPTAHGRRA